MKLRIKGNSLRLRLTQADVKQLETSGEVAEQVRFGAGATLTYRLYSDLRNSEITASYADNVVEIRIPERVCLQWCRTTEVTLSHVQDLGDGELRIAVEKDFACLAPRTKEDESDNFPHPGAADGHKAC